MPTQEDLVDAKFLRENWSRMTASGIAEKFRVPTQAVWRKARRLGLTRRAEALPPSPREIDARAAEVRAKWTDLEHESRLVGSRARLTIQQIRVGEGESPTYSRMR